MRREDLSAVVDAVKGPTDRFVRESRVRTCLLVNGAGQVLAQYGFTKSYEVVNVASLAAAAHAAAGALAKMTEAGGWTHLHNQGKDRQLFLAPFRTPVETLVLVAIFDDESSLGVVQFFYDRLVEEVRALPALQAVAPIETQAAFERDLEAGVGQVLPTEADGGG